MTRFGVSPEKEAALEARMRRWGIREGDLVETFVRSSGAGGQNVNKVATCVVLRHPPSGIEVRCQRERSQAVNRFLARRLLCDRMEERILGAESAERRRIERIRRQKRTRSRKAKRKILEAKHRRAETKEMRRPPRDWE